MQFEVKPGQPGQLDIVQDFAVTAPETITPWQSYIGSIAYDPGGNLTALLHFSALDSKLLLSAIDKALTDDDLFGEPLASWLILYKGMLSEVGRIQNEMEQMIGISYRLGDLALLSFAVDEYLAATTMDGKTKRRFDNLNRFLLKAKATLDKAIADGLPEKRG